MPLTTVSNAKSYSIGSYTNLVVTAITGVTATSTVPGQISLTWSGGVGNNIKYSYALSSGTIQSVSGVNPTTITLTTTNQVTTTVTVTATVLGGSTSATSNSVTTIVLVPTDSMLYYYRMNSGDIVTKLANYAPYNNGSIIGYDANINTGFSINTTNQKIGSGCGYFNGTANNGFFPPALSFTNGQGLTFCCWVYTSTITNVGRLLNSNTSPYFQIMQNGSGNLTANFGGVSVTTSTVIFGTSTWTHIVVTVSPSVSACVVSIYINGVYNTASSSGSSMATNSYPLTVGTDGGSGGNYTGYMDDWRIYSRVLTTTEITNLYNYTGP